MVWLSMDSSDLKCESKGKRDHKSVDELIKKQ